MGDYAATLTRVEDYFDRTATQTWARLTSDAPVSKIRHTVRAGRDRMRAVMLGQLPEDLTGARVLDAGCGAGQMTAELAARGAEVVAIDISPALVDIAAERLDPALSAKVTFRAGDMLADDLGAFDHVIAMDSLIYYNAADIGTAMGRLAPRVGQVVFTVAPRTPFLMAFWGMGQLFPRADRSPTMVPHKATRLARHTADHGTLSEVERVTSGFYISQCLELRP
ncbi:magnesium protoporphyrin IX methyltransferase [Actibacterium sp. 188UL27-1]|uniref:magnesium protoporphyrin IX methyltransferase n=1 Tax=Actibacterium sp. 188UL27-1 TaxID=2786961 RepID=UPI0019599D9F|nr:magnesium protoporphyrin IX methyltransferase [Actibacterium sp. 188UL27-1]MBM7068600.1 magnesium protoporphyrin IX methyltransferase [Actibacterium sp. 188UL27-1]